MATPRTRIYVALLAVYTVWGSTYLAIRYVVETLPPLLSAGVRFIIAGAALYLWARAHGAAKPTKIHWRSTAIIGAFLLVGGNGGVVFAEQRVPSGLAALLVTTSPLWMVLLEWLQGGLRPTLGVVTGLLLGFAGVALLVNPMAHLGHTAVDPMGAAVLLVAAFLWACGSIYSRRAQLPESSLLATGMEMVTGGAMQIVVGLLLGEWARFDPSAVSLQSVLGVIYLIIFGSWIGFSAYIWLLRTVSVTVVSTYAFVNPIVAVLLGCWIGHEPLTWSLAAAAGLIIAGVVLIITQRARAKT